MSYRIEDAVKRVITENVLSQTELAQDAPAGAIELVLGSTATLPVGAEIALVGSEDQIEIVTVCDRIDEFTLRIGPALQSSFKAGSSTAQRSFGGQFVRHIASGNPPSFDSYPAITVEDRGHENNPLTLGTVGILSQNHQIIVTIWNEQTDYAQSRRVTQQMTEAIEGVLFRSVFPLVEPYCQTTLTEDMSPEVTTIRIEHPGLFAGAYPLPIEVHQAGERWWFQIVEQLDGNTFRIQPGRNKWFYRDRATVIRPRVHVYDSLCEGASYDVNQDNLYYGQLTYRCSLARHRYHEPFI